MTTYRARAEWDGYNWVAVPDAGGVTQAKRLDLLPARVAEVIHLITGDSVDPTEIVLDIRYGDLGEKAAALREQRSHLDAEERQLAKATAETARALRARGMNLRDIGTMTGVSHQRAHQLVSSGG